MDIQLNDEQQAMLAGERGLAKQMAMRLLLDMAAAAGATELIPIKSAHLSGVSPLMVPLAMRSPERTLQPFTVWCASCCAMFQ